MIRSVKEVHEGKTAHGDGFLFWTYLICRVDSGCRGRYNLIRIDNVCETMEVLGRELTLDHCRRIIREKEATGSLRSSKRR